MLWHYKHTLVKCWGGTVLQSFLKDFPNIAEGDEVACTSWEVLDWDECFATPTTPPLSSAELGLFSCSYIVLGMTIGGIVGFRGGKAGFSKLVLWLYFSLVYCRSVLI